MTREATEIAKIESRISELAAWLQEHAPQYRTEHARQWGTEHKHLEQGNQQQVFWHYGYMVALRDTLRLLTGELHNDRGDA